MRKTALSACQRSSTSAGMGSTGYGKVAIDMKLPSIRSLPAGLGRPTAALKKLLAHRRGMPWVLIVIAVPAMLLALPRLLPKTLLSARMPSSVAVYDAQHHLLRLTLASDEQYRLWGPLSKVSPDCSDHDFHIAMANVNPINSLIPLQWKSTITPQRFGFDPAHLHRNQRRPYADAQASAPVSGGCSRCNGAHAGGQPLAVFLATRGAGRSDHATCLR